MLYIQQAESRGFTKRSSCSFDVDPGVGNATDTTHCLYPIQEELPGPTWHKGCQAANTAFKVYMTVLVLLFFRQATGYEQAYCFCSYRPSDKPDKRGDTSVYHAIRQVCIARDIAELLIAKLANATLELQASEGSCHAPKPDVPSPCASTFKNSVC